LGGGGISVGASQLGSFNVSLTANSVNIGSIPLPYAFPSSGNSQTSGYHLTGFAVNAPTCTIAGGGACDPVAISFADIGFAFDFAVTTPAAGSFGSPTSFGAPGTGSSSAASAGSGSGVGGVVLGNAGTAASLSSETGSSPIGSSQSGEGIPLHGLPSITDTEMLNASTTEGTQNSSQYELPAEVVSAAPTEAIGTTVESTQNSGEYVNVANPNLARQLTGPEDTCPRGASQVADLGSRRSFGSTPNVFKKCRRN
jgi:hypothetical protein